MLLTQLFKNITFHFFKHYILNMSNVLNLIINHIII